MVDRPSDAAKALDVRRPAKSWYAASRTALSLETFLTAFRNAFLTPFFLSALFTTLWIFFVGCLLYLSFALAISSLCRTSEPEIQIIERSGPQVRKEEPTPATDDDIDEADFLDTGNPEVALVAVFLSLVVVVLLLLWRFG